MNNDCPSHTTLMTAHKQPANDMECPPQSPTMAIPLTFQSSQGCMAVLIDTCTALARFIGHLWRHNPMQVGVPVGFCKPSTCICENLHLLTWVWVLMGTGMGYSGKPQGSPWHSLAAHVTLCNGLTCTCWSLGRIWTQNATCWCHILAYNYLHMLCRSHARVTICDIWSLSHTPVFCHITWDVAKTSLVSFDIVSPKLVGHLDFNY